MTKLNDGIVSQIVICKLTYCHCVFGQRRVDRPRNSVQSVHVQVHWQWKENISVLLIREKQGKTYKYNHTHRTSTSERVICSKNTTTGFLQNRRLEKNQVKEKLIAIWFWSITEMSAKRSHPWRILDCVVHLLKMFFFDKRPLVIWCNCFPEVLNHQ